MRIDHSIKIAAPLRTVWDLTVDVESWPEISPYVTRATRLDPGELRPGSRVRIKQPGQGPRVWTVDQYRAPDLFVWSTRVLWLTMTATHELAPAGDGTRNDLAIDLTGRGSGVLGLLLGGMVRKVLRAENEGFKRAAESRVAVERGGQGP